MRLQLHNGFTFEDAAALVPYMRDLGISHVYASPILTARAGSIHGYDVVDPNTINPELGGEPAFRNFVAVLRNAGARPDRRYRTKSYGRWRVRQRMVD